MLLPKSAYFQYDISLCSAFHFIMFEYASAKHRYAYRTRIKKLMLYWGNKISKEQYSNTQMHALDEMFSINIAKRNSERWNIEIILEGPLDQITTIFDKILRLCSIFLHS